MKKIKIFAMIDVGIMVLFLLFTYITEYIQKHDTGEFAGLSPRVMWSVLFLRLFFMAAAILVLLLYIIISVHFINRSMKPLEKIAITAGIIFIVSDVILSAFNYFYGISELPPNGVDFLFNVYTWIRIILLSILAFTAIVCISVLIIRKIKNKQSK